MSSPSSPQAARMDELRVRYPGRIPVFVSKSKSCTNTRIADISRKFLVPMELTVAEFVSVLRKKIVIKATDAIYLFVGNSLPPGTYTFGQLDTMYRDPAMNALLIEYAGEASFGCPLE